MFQSKYLIVLTVCATLTGCQIKSTETPQERVFPVAIQRIETTSCVQTHTYIGDIEEANSLQLSFPYGGQLTRLHVHKNSHVNRGQLLAQVDNTQENSMLQAAQAKLQQAEDGYTRAQQVHRDGGLTELKWVEVQSSLKEAQSAVAGCQKRLNDCNLYAPISGFISDINSSIGENLAPNQAVLTLLNINELNASFTVAEKDISSIRMGDTAKIIVPALGDALIRGQVVEKTLTAEPLSHTYLVKCRMDIPASLRHDLLPGMVAKVQLTSQLARGYMLPSRCVQLTPKGTVVWVMQNGKAQRRIVTDCVFVNESVLVQNGLSQGDSVVVEGQHKLFSGARIIDNGSL